MGFTGFPYDATQQAVDDTTEFINSHGDLVTVHNDHGVPWPEALEGFDFSQALLDDIAGSVARIGPGKKIYVSATAQSTNRSDGLAPYWGNTDNMDLPPEWASKTIDDPDVIAAYLNWCRFLITQFNPDYFAYGIEANGGFSSPTDPRFIRFENFLDSVYPILKSDYPDLPIFLSVQTSNTESSGQPFFDMTAELLNYSDWVGISSYPYFRWDINNPIGIITTGNPNDIPIDHLSAIRDLAPNKPVAITETGYPAQDLIIPMLAVNQPGTQRWQASYVDKLFRELQSFEAEFVVWFVPRDHDMLNNTIFPSGTDDPIYFIWRDTGLLDENGAIRQGLVQWDHWLGVPVAKKNQLSIRELLQSPHAYELLKERMTSEPTEPCPKSIP